MRLQAYFGFLLFCCTSTCGAGLLDDLADLKDKYVIYAGEFEKLDCPIGGNYDCLSWPTDLLKTKDGSELCISSTKFTHCSFTCRGMIAAGQDKVPYLYLFESSLGSDLSKHGFQPYKCPSTFP